MEDIVIDDTCLNKYHNLSEEELKRCKALSRDCDRVFRFRAGCTHDDRETEKRYGVRALPSQPLVQVLSVSVESDDKSLAIHGTVHAEFWYRGQLFVHQLYNRRRKKPQFVGTSGVLALNGQDSREPDYACLPLVQNKMQTAIGVMLSDRKGNEFAREHIQLNDEIEDNGFEAVRSKSIPCKQSGARLTVRYIVIPFGVSCLTRITVHSDKDYSFDVSGKIVANYGSTEEGCVVLFDKPEIEGREWECRRKNLQLSRCWVAVPAHSPIVVDVNLSIVGKDNKVKVVKDSLSLLPLQCGTNYDSILVDDFLINVEVGWRSPDYHWPEDTDTQSSSSTEDTDEFVGDDNSDDVLRDDDGLQSNTSLQRSQPSPSPSFAVEIFSVFVGREKPMEAQLYGSIEVLCDDETICTVFKRDGKDAFTLSQNMKFIPVSDGSRVYWEYGPYTLEIKLDIKDVVEGSLAVKGHVDWKEKQLRDARLLCSLFRGQHGFVAVHYAVFPEAVEAKIKVTLKFKRMSVGIDPMVCGSVTAQYGCFDYSSKYNKEYYRSVLFERDGDDSVKLGVDGTIPLSRSLIVVPSNSSVDLIVGLSFGDFAEKLSQIQEEIEIGESCKVVETSDVSLVIDVDWCEIR